MVAWAITLFYVIILVLYFILKQFSFVVLLSPINSTELESSTTGTSHDHLDLSRIAPPGEVQGQGEDAVLAGPGERPTTLVPEDMVLTSISVTHDPSDQLKCHCGKECTR